MANIFSLNGISNRTTTSFRLLFDRQVDVNFLKDEIYLASDATTDQTKWVLIATLTGSEQYLDCSGLKDGRMYWVHGIRYYNNSSPNTTMTYNLTSRYSGAYTYRDSYVPFTSGQWVENWRNLDDWITHCSFNQEILKPVLMPSDGTMDGDFVRLNQGAPTGWAMQSKYHFNKNKPINVKCKKRLNVTSGTAQKFGALVLYVNETQYHGLATGNGHSGVFAYGASNGTTYQTTDINDTLINNTVYNWEIDWNPSTGIMSFYQNGVKVHSSSVNFTEHPKLWICNVYSEHGEVGNQYVDFGPITVTADGAVFADTNGDGDFFYMEGSQIASKPSADSGPNYGRGGLVLRPTTNIDYLDVAQTYSYAQTAITTTEKIVLPSGYLYGNFSHIEQLNGQSVKYQILDRNQTLIPDTVVPNNSQGLTANNVSLTNITSGPIIIQAQLSSSNSSQTPIIQNMTVEFIPKDTTAPAPPTGLTCKAFDSMLFLSWNSNTESDLAGYYLYVNGNILRKNIIKSTSFGVFVDNSSSHTIYLTAVDRFGNESSPSTAITTNTSVIPTIKSINRKKLNSGIKPGADDLVKIFEDNQLRKITKDLGTLANGKISTASKWIKNNSSKAVLVTLSTQNESLNIVTYSLDGVTYGVTLTFLMLPYEIKNFYLQIDLTQNNVPEAFQIVKNVRIGG